MCKSYKRNSSYQSYMQITVCLKIYASLLAEHHHSNRSDEKIILIGQMKRTEVLLMGQLIRLVTHLRGGDK